MLVAKMRNVIISKTPSLRLRLRVARLRLSKILFGICSVPVRRLFGLCSPFVRCLSTTCLVYSGRSMDANLQEILDNLDEKAPRSRLGPYRDLILELRRRNRTYREILQILGRSLPNPCFNQYAA